MSLPASEPIPMPEDELPPARRRRLKRLVVPEDGDEQTRLLDELGKRAIPGAEFYLSALLAGIAAGVGFLFDSPALVVLSALLAPFMGPVMGIPLATIAGSGAFFFRSLGGLMIGSVIFLLTGTLSGWVARLFPPQSTAQVSYHITFTWADVALLTTGMVLALALMVRNPHQRPLVASVAVAYALYLPLSAAGFGLTSGAPLAWEMGLLVFLAHLIWAALAGTLALVILGLRPMRFLSYALTGAYALACLAGALIYFLSSDAAIRTPVQGAGLAVQPIPSPTQPVISTMAGGAPGQATPQPEMTDTLLSPPTETPTLRMTNTLVPTRTATISVTPEPTPVWARINARGGDGAFIRSEPRYDAEIVVSLLNGNIVEVLLDVATADGVTWVKVRTADQREGWIVRSLLATATPAPGW